LWAERWWLVTPTLGGEMTVGLVELSLAVAFAAALVLCVGWIAPRFLPAPEETNRP
jgi:hypothetical protein